MSKPEPSQTMSTNQVRPCPKFMHYEHIFHWLVRVSLSPTWGIDLKLFTLNWV